MRLKASTVGELRIDRGRLFQSSEPNRLNDQSPMVLWVSGVLSRVVSIAERSPSLAGTFQIRTQVIKHAFSSKIDVERVMQEASKRRHVFK